MKRVSIIIVTYNSERDIYDCITSIKEHADIPLSDIELIVVDNQSNAPQPMFNRLRQQWGTDIVLIENTQNGGYGQGNNVGIRKSTAPIILIMNPDVRLMDPFFKTPLDEFEKNPQLCVCGMKQMLTATKSSTFTCSFTYMMNGYFRTLLTGICSRFDYYYAPLMYFSGSCFFIRKLMFEQVGLFDESIFMYGEEDDIHHRICKKFGPKMKYLKHLHYMHLIDNRLPDVKYETKLLDVAIVQNDKNGYPPHKTIRTFLQINSVLLFRMRLLRLFGKEDPEQLKMLREFRRIILQKRIEVKYNKEKGNNNEF